MFAIANSRIGQGARRSFQHRGAPAGFVASLLFVAGLVFCGDAGLAPGDSATAASGVSTNRQPDFAGRSRAAYETARTRFLADTNDVRLAWQFGRASFDWAEFSSTDKDRERLANEGINACRFVVGRSNQLAQGHYYLGMNLGQLARTKLLGAIRLVDEMERGFLMARQLDETLDYAGPDRNLGLLYLKAPGWPTSVGSRPKARQHLERAAALAPGYPDNRLNLAEAYLKWNDRDKLRAEMKAIEELLPKARIEFVGVDWEMGWVDWEVRWAQLKRKAGSAYPAALSPKSTGL